jgi:hypothetical protein
MANDPSSSSGAGRAGSEADAATGEGDCDDGLDRRVAAGSSSSPDLENGADPQASLNAQFGLLRRSKQRATQPLPATPVARRMERHTSQSRCRERSP